MTTMIMITRVINPDQVGQHSGQVLMVVAMLKENCGYTERLVDKLLLQ